MQWEYACPGFGGVCPDLFATFATFAAISVSFMAGLGVAGAVRVEPHGDGNQRVFITVPVDYARIPSGSYIVPSCMSSNVQRKLFGRKKAIERLSGVVWLSPVVLATYLELLGYKEVVRIRQAAQGHAIVPLLTRKALEALGRGDLWPPDWPPAPPPGVQPPQPQIQNPQIMDEMVAGQPPPLPVSFGPAPLYFSIRIFKTHAKSIFISVQAGASESVPCGVAVHFVTVGPCLWLCVAGGR
jgi:hypothetical protein